MNTNDNTSSYLPTTVKEAAARGWDELDVILFTGDAYVDHPSFGAAVMGRVLEEQGLRAAIVPQPNWQDDLRDFKKFRSPRLFFGVTSGAMDSMVNHYTAKKRLRSTDAYTPGGKAGFRPHNATVVYTKILKQLFPEVPVIIGGIEASLRRVTHYDYWAHILKPSILAESGADLLVYGMGEQPVKEIVRLFNKNVPFSSIKRTIPQTAWLLPQGEELRKNKKWETLELASHEDCTRDKKVFAKNFTQLEREWSTGRAQRLVQKTGPATVIINPPYPPMSTKEIDSVYELPFTRQPHPRYRKKEPIPAYEMIQSSVTIHRGCFGGCAFCALSAHQGKRIASRSKASVLKEVEQLRKIPGFKGIISDLGGPSANMYGMKGVDITKCETCARVSCIYPSICANLNISHKELVELYRQVRALPGIKKVFIGSGIRYDLLVEEEKKGKGKPDSCRQEHGNNYRDEYIRELAEFHVSGRLKVAPEHTSKRVLDLMRKPSFELFYRFKKKFEEINKEKGLDQHLVPYFMSAHPGCDLEDMANLALETKKLGYRLEQVQGFTPTPMTLSAVIYYTGIDPYTGKKVYSAKTDKEKRHQERFFFWYKPENSSWFKKTLKSLKFEV
ncbi:MAG: YgiQ family radical SAM protein [bacterium]|nr:YgiQ family radical SAM protein [bacterium]